MNRSSIEASAAAEEKKSDEDGDETMPSPETPASNEPAPTSHGPNVRVSDHPVLRHKLSVLRSSSTRPSSFRSVLREVTFHLGYEATSDLTTRDIPLTVPGPTGSEEDHVEATGHRLSQKVALIPILRSGLGMVDPMSELLGDATVHHVGMYRTKALMPVQYYNRLPKACDVDVAYVLDPLVATSCTVISVVGILKKWGVPEIHVLSAIASRRGLSELVKYHPDVKVTVGTVDDGLDAEGNVLPGMGDAGDRLFGTPPVDDDEELVHPSKRKRTMSDLGS